ncbi:MAG: LysR family transcriptional regulator [Sphingomonadales bacterium]|nr:LysR family transcriptional regulator [Sphingomonadales bacterium]
MDSRKLRHAVALARFLNFTKAAESLGLTQSALTRSIQSLEQDYRVRLFDRNRNMVAVTVVGRDFLRHAEKLLRDEAELASMASMAARGESGRIALGMAPLAARTLLAPLMAEMIDKPGFSANVTTGAPNRLLPLLVDEKAEICVCTGHTAPANVPYTGILLAKFPVGIVVRKHHPITAKARLTPEDLAPFPLLLTRASDTDDGAGAIVHLVPSRQPALSVEDYDVLTKVTADSDGIWISSPMSAREGIASGILAYRPIDWLGETVEISMTAYVLKHRSLSPLAQNVLDRLIALCAGLDRFADTGAKLTVAPASGARGF